MKNANISPSTFSVIIPIGLLFLFIFLKINRINEIFDYQWNSEIESKTECRQDSMEVDDMQRGAHVFGIRDTTNFQALIRNNIEWVTLVTWGYQNDYDSPIVTHHNTSDSLQLLRHTSSLLKRIESVRNAGFKVFFKPHLWINNPSNRERRSDIYPTNEANWELWKKSYRNFILDCAKTAEQTNVEMFCIGTELSKLTTEKPVYWKNLIQEVRNIYSGKITYAANWYNEFEEITFWDELDFVGIQAYFPLVKNKYPTVKQISRGWNKYFPAIESIHKKYNRKILFTEMGYKSTANSAIEPWRWLEHGADQDKHFSTETQSNCYEAFFNTVWKKEWFAGVHIWQLRSNYVERPGKNNLDFTPQGKPAENIIAKGFK